MEFKKFKKQLQEHFSKMTKDVDYLFEVELDKDELWNLYLDSFPEGTNEIYRERREYDCSCCKQFIRNIGNVVTIKNGKVTSIWDINTNSNIFKPVANALSEFVKSKLIYSVFLAESKKLGTDFNYEYLDTEINKYEHFYLELDNKFVKDKQISLGSIQGEYRNIKGVFKRSLDEISIESLNVVLELISQKSLYKGEEWKSILKEFLKYKNQYVKLQSDKEKDLFAWENSVKAGSVIGKIRNHSIGTLLIDISEGMELDMAVRRYEKIVAPSNYKRPKAIYTKKMLENAKKTIQELGYMESLSRRFANINDITVNNTLFINRDTASKIKTNDVFEKLGNEISVNPKKFSKVEEIEVESFVKDVLPSITEMEVLLENRHEKNLVSLIAPINQDSKTMFKWDNNFSWTYNGNMTDSDIRENVKNAGGKVDGVLRFSIQWNDREYDDNDLDAHCKEPSGNHIYFSSRRNYKTTGMLDIDIQMPSKGNPAVENITWSNINAMEEGTYLFYVNNYANRKGKDGFRAEIECGGEIYQFDYTKPLRQDENVKVAKVHFSRANGFKVETLLPSNVSNKEMWGLTTNKFIPVTLMTYSPNYWNEQEGIGNKHYLFMLQGCINNDNPNGFFNEYLKNELTPHRKVFEALGSKMSVETTENQLSGLGFSSTRRNDLIVKVKGSYERVLKIKF